MPSNKTYTLDIHEDDDGSVWGQFRELPGCIASGQDINELLEAAEEALALILEDDSEPRQDDNVVAIGSRQKREDRHLRPTSVGFAEAAEA